ncbi:MAG TPA: hypothetical protein VHM02_12170, partial [Thermoanaerobaculia bacterium]|nr:hypothetical protein [Thermoanaerobaculia bacterium]
ALVAAAGGPPAARLIAFLSGEVAPVRYQVYRAAGEWLRRHAAPGERVAALEVGTIGFFAERPIHDLLGLVSRASRPALARGDLPAAFLAGQPDLFVALPANPLSAAIERAPWFPGAFREVARLRHRRAGFEVVVYRRRPGASAALIAAGPSAASPAADRR